MNSRLELKTCCWYNFTTSISNAQTKASGLRSHKVKELKIACSN